MLQAAYGCSPEGPIVLIVVNLTMLFTYVIAVWSLSPVLRGKGNRAVHAHEDLIILGIVLQTVSASKLL